MDKQNEMHAAVSAMVDTHLALRLARVVRNAAEIPYVIGTWAPGGSDVGRAAKARNERAEVMAYVRAIRVRP